MKDFKNKVKEFVKEKISKKLIADEFVVIKSLPGCQHQAPHFDYDSEYLVHNHSANPLPEDIDVAEVWKAEIEQEKLSDDKDYPPHCQNPVWFVLE